MKSARSENCAIMALWWRGIVALWWRAIMGVVVESNHGVVVESNHGVVVENCSVNCVWMWMKTQSISLRFGLTNYKNT